MQTQLVDLANRLDKSDDENKPLETDNDFGRKSKQAWVKAAAKQGDTGRRLPATPQEALALLVPKDKAARTQSEGRQLEADLGSYEALHEEEEDDAPTVIGADDKFDRIEKMSNFLSGIFSSGEIPSVRR